MTVFLQACITPSPDQKILNLENLERFAYHNATMTRECRESLDALDDQFNLYEEYSGINKYLSVEKSNVDSMRATKFHVYAAYGLSFVILYLPSLGAPELTPISLTFIFSTIFKIKHIWTTKELEFHRKHKPKIYSGFAAVVFLSFFQKEIATRITFIFLVIALLDYTRKCNKLVQDYLLMNKLINSSSRLNQLPDQTSNHRIELIDTTKEITTSTYKNMQSYCDDLHQAKMALSNEIEVSENALQIRDQIQRVQKCASHIGSQERPSVLDLEDWNNFIRSVKQFQNA